MISTSRHRFALVVFAASLFACDSAPIGDTTTTTPPPPPATPVPVTLAVNPLARKATAQPGTPAPSDNAAVTITGDSADTVTWVATSRHPWTSLVSSVGKGSGAVTWLRNTAGLGLGTYVDTITVSAAGAADSPVMLLDTLEITAAPVPLTLTVTPASRSASAIQHASVAGDNIGITLSGDGAGSTAWSVTSNTAWDVVQTGVGTGSGTAGWSRQAAGLSPGVYVDTLTVTAPGASGSPARVLDSLTIIAPLSMAVSATSTQVSALKGGTAASSSVALTFNGAGAAIVAWSVSKRKPWNTLTTTSGVGAGTVAWSHNTVGLVPGTYVDTMTIVAADALGSPFNVIDTLTLTAAPAPLTLAVTPHSFATVITQGANAPAATAAVSITGDNAANVAWTAAKRQSWTTLTTSASTGSGTVVWTRSTAALPAGTYVDTITVTANGAAGSPTLLLDSIVVSPASGGVTADLGVDADLHGKQVFPASNAWNQPVDTAQVDPNSNLILSTIGLNTSLHPDWGSTWGIPYQVVADDAPRYTLAFDYASESDPGPYPIPACPAIEGATVACGPGSGDSHLLVITQNEWKLYEIFSLAANGTGGWTGGSGAIFDLTNGTTRPAGWTSADAAGLPIFPGLVRYDEVYLHGAINHALRFTVQHTRNAYVAPASHVASSLSGAQYAPMGMRVRLKASFDISGYPAPMQVILKALKKYGMMVADNGSNFFVSGTIDPRWNDDYDNLLKQVHVSDFELVKMTGVVTP